MITLILWFIQRVLRPCSNHYIVEDETDGGSNNMKENRQ